MCKNCIVFSGRGNTGSYTFTVCNVAFSVKGARDFRIDFLRLSDVTLVNRVNDSSGLSWRQESSQNQSTLLSYASHVKCHPVCVTLLFTVDLLLQIENVNDATDIFHSLNNMFVPLELLILN